MADEREFPQSFGKYTLLAKLGHGGMAEVFLALLTGPGGFRKLVVVKRTHVHLLDEPGFTDMFLDEARLAARLSHPNVVQTHEVAVEGVRPYLAMEYLEGQPLNRILGRVRREGRRVPYPMLAHMFLGVLDGLHYAHTLRDYDGAELQVVHRDVSPHNLFVTYQGAIKVLDFGVAKAAGRIVESKTGEMKGKLAYSPPDQAVGLELDARADVWSCGVILWQATTNQALFRADNDMATIHNVMSKEVPPLASLDRDVPDKFAEAVDRALVRDRDARWNSAAAMRRCLAEYLSEARPVPTRTDVEELVAALFFEERDAHRRIIEEALSGEAPSITGLQPLISSTPSTTNTTVEEIEQVRSRQRRRKRRMVVIAAIAFGLLVGTTVPLVLHLVRPTSAPTPVAVPAPAPVPATAPLPAAVAPPPPPPVVAEVPESPPPPEAEAAPPVTPKPAPRPARRPRTADRASRSASTAAAATAASAPGRSASRGKLTLDTTPWSEVLLDGKKLGTTPLIEVSLPVGEHTLQLQNPERGLKKSYRVSIKAGQTTKKRLGLD